MAVIAFRIIQITAYAGNEHLVGFIGDNRRPWGNIRLFDTYTSLPNHILSVSDSFHAGWLIVRFQKTRGVLWPRRKTTRVLCRNLVFPRTIFPNKCRRKLCRRSFCIRWDLR